MKLVEPKFLDKLMNKNDTYVIAVSTGIDSMSLLHFLSNEGYKLVVAHVNHKRRIESDNEYIFLENYCKERKIPFEGYVLSENIESNFQMEARNIRYKFFKRVADKYNTKFIITAHQADDLTETITFRLLRGTSIKGYSGINEISETDEYTILRPLLYTTRNQIIEYQKDNNIIYFDDSSNNEDHYTRNKIRHHIIPYYKEINESFYNSIINFKEDMYDSYSFIKKEADKFTNNAEYGTNSIKINYVDFYNLERIIKKQVVVNCFNKLSNDTLEIPHERINKIIDFVSNGEAREIEINNEYYALFEYESITFIKRTKLDNKFITINGCGEFKLNNYKIIVSQKTHELPNKNSYMLCYNSEDEIFPITVRYAENGDKIKINNINKKVFDLFKEHKVPVNIRDKSLVFLNKDGIFFIPYVSRKETNKSKLNTIYITVREE